MYIVTPRDVLRIQEILRITYLVRSLSCSRPSRARSRCVRPDVAVSSSSRRSSCRTTPPRQRAHPSAGSSWPCRACGPRGTGRSSLGSGTSERYRSKQSAQRNKREVQVEAVWAAEQARGTDRSSPSSGTSERYRSKQSGQRNKREVQIGRAHV